MTSHQPRLHFRYEPIEGEEEAEEEKVDDFHLVGGDMEDEEEEYVDTNWTHFTSGKEALEYSDIGIKWFILADFVAKVELYLDRPSVFDWHKFIHERFPRERYTFAYIYLFDDTFFDKDEFNTKRLIPFSTLFRDMDVYILYHWKLIQYKYVNEVITFYTLLINPHLRNQFAHNVVLCYREHRLHTDNALNVSSIRDSYVQFRAVLTTTQESAKQLIRLFIQRPKDSWYETTLRRKLQTIGGVGVHYRNQIKLISGVDPATVHPFTPLQRDVTDIETSPFLLKWASHLFDRAETGRNLELLNKRYENILTELLAMYRINVPDGKLGKREIEYKLLYRSSLMTLVFVTRWIYLIQIQEEKKIGLYTLTKQKQDYLYNEYTYRVLPFFLKWIHLLDL